ncbi:MAG: nicotinate-nucleotide adenylyltransferase [Verrucomicrobiota bacterium]|nr:nicotinate-nucleotide adenylyltransferase [Verrucomicrobiota bacterium]
MKKIGVYGGTFDPIHCAHLILAREALEKLGLDEIIFVPAAISPHKPTQTPADAPARVEMLRAAIEGEGRFCLDELELNRPPLSYTFDTMTELKQRHPHDQFFYLIGSDNLPRLETWHRFAELRELVQFVVLHRGVGEVRSDFPTIMRHLDISATEIRKRVASGRSIRYLVPLAVEEIITRRQLYTEPPR